MFCNELERLLSTVFAEARRKRQASVSPEHVLAVLTEAKSLAPFWRAFQIDTQALGSRLRRYIDHSTALQPEGARNDTQGTFEFHRLMQQAVLRVYRADNTALVRPHDLLLELCSTRSSYGAAALEELGITSSDIAGYFQDASMSQASAASQRAGNHNDTSNKH